MNHPRNRARLASRVLAMVAALLVPLAACGVDREGPPGEFTLIIGDSYPTTHPASRDGVEFFMKRVGELTDGRVSFKYFPSDQVGKAEDYISLTRAGVTDIGVVSPPYLSAKLPLSNVADLPGMSTEACPPARALTELMSENGLLHEQEYAPRGIRMLFVGVQPKYEIFTGDGKLVTEPADMRGLLLRSSGGVLDQAVHRLGSAPVSIPGPEMYEAISRGTVDGTVLPTMSATPYRLDEVATNSTEGAPLGSFTLTYAISEEIWRQLPADLRDAVSRAGRETTEHLCRAIDAENASSREQLAEGGLTFTTLSQEQVADWRRAVAPVREQWVADMESMGRPGRATLEAMTAALREQSGGSR
ncbi:TRAP-type C4-dicarboxylate transport system substrate-binding protein [Tamaricihabitans halophyticus]|uniref:TRAP-type C4-dicarboxylate transport system substrate-binding protein n=1 Tax=Tamaricihabitans halophyticus TaxID=1262583 RepID=A0A4V2SRM7_9PSEU|nr:TRAP transporter substrate-binding protein DctP [Tamaricihabitans halophyticus]TCP43426.1 TRAP-type C4-dicarboxylate transport system substrate-binding protein [Tamaricihabitans halophyticus]